MVVCNLSTRMLKTHLYNYKILCNTKKSVKAGTQTNHKTMIYSWALQVEGANSPHTKDLSRGHYAMKELWTLSSVISTPRICESWILGFTSKAMSTFVLCKSQLILEMGVLNSGSLKFPRFITRIRSGEIRQTGKKIDIRSFPVWQRKPQTGLFLVVTVCNFIKLI